ncbi:PilC/PilY family type IV pilus protein [Guyparkeria sp. GHLCS8-2]|uniref:pilus assembly protein n=1 Tax=Guyparkeria halopsychrophila TaxID=3139421 RepID=UPI0037C6F02F
MNISMRYRALSCYLRGLGRRHVVRVASSLLFAAGLWTGQAAAITIDQTPLIVQQSLPPNVMLLLDDSGSMAREYMPDSGYLSDTSDQGMQSASANYIYYDENVTYEPPAKPDGTSYADVTTFPTLPLDGFDSSSSTTDVTAYYSTGGYANVSFPFFRAFCPSGTTQSSVHYGRCYSGTYYNDADHVYLFQDSGNNNYYYEADALAFVYTTPDGSGGYDEHYVATNCADLPSGAQGSCADDAATQQNVGNWFGYYRTRMLAAKSGLMNGFADVSEEFRVGFGSINGNSADFIRSITAGDCGDVFNASCRYGFATDTESNNEFAGVAVWGDGSSGTRKAQFWEWLEAAEGNQNTPLRETLEAAGEYYRTGQPWSSEDSSGTSQEHACRQSYTILTSDGFWNEVGDPDPDVGNADGTSGATLGDDGTGSMTAPNGIEYTYDAVDPYSDDFSNTLADVAMYYWKNDLRTGLENQVPTTGEDPAFWQHMTTFSVGLGYEPLDANGNAIDADAVFDWANGGDLISGFSWPQPSSGSINNIADMLHAAVNGHGGFYSAKSAQAFSAAIADAVGRTAERVGTGASLAANSTRLETGTVTYQANYFTGTWVGDLKAYPVDPATKQIATYPDWSAADNLLAAPADSCSASVGQVCPDGRTIYTYATDDANLGNNDPLYREFLATDIGSLSNAQQAALGGTAAERQAIVDFLRGDTANAEANGGGYRDRSTALGDIVNSQPVYVGQPDPNLHTSRSFTGVSTYAAFAEDPEGDNDNQGVDPEGGSNTREPLVYVAANDGMLHGFDATTGEEHYAFLPGAVIEAGIKKLADPDYGANPGHEYFNDGELTVADVYIDLPYTNGNDVQWRTVLVGSTGRGEAKTVYALDITDPANIRFLWERSAGDGGANAGYIGQMVGKPLVVQTADAEWSVLIGNGYNSTNDSAALLQFDVGTGALDVHVTNDGITGNGLAAPATFDYTDSPDGIQDVAYAGDLNGWVWRFDLSSSTSVGEQVYQATDGTNAQPITAGLLLGKDPATNNLWAFFGTGKYLSQGDLDDQSVQTWYGLIVESGDADLPVSSGDGRSVLVERDIVDEQNNGTFSARAFSKGAVNDMDGKSGWYMDLISPDNGVEGERMVEPNQFQGEVLVGTSLIPDAVNICNPSGRGFIMGVDPFDGTNVEQPFVDYNGDGVVDASDTITVNGETFAVGAIGFNRLPNAPIFVGNTMLISFDDGSTASVEAAGGGSSGQRSSWREIIFD